LFRLDGQNVYRCDALSQFPWLEHGFGTRLSNGWPDLNRLVTPKQIHSNRVLLVEPGAPTGPAARLGEGDALVCRSGDSIVGIRTADCVPILVVDERNRAVGAIHAGWRGTVSEISSHTVDIMTCQFGTSPEDIWAAIGPSIGRCCFQVGPEVAAHFPADLHHQSCVDLPEANRRQLENAGVRPDRIFVSGLCTVCQSSLFHSYRRDKEQAGRMISAIKTQKA
jgi:polyphenol oxidase